MDNNVQLCFKYTLECDVNHEDSAERRDRLHKQVCALVDAINATDIRLVLRLVRIHNLRGSFFD